MKIAYVEKNFSDSHLATIAIANRFIAKYVKIGQDLTLRQLYYRFVAAGHITNSDKEYKKLGSVLNDARLAGLVSWRAIQDRTRNLQGNVHWGAPDEMVKARAETYQTEKWASQPMRVEVWVEKDALVGIVGSAAAPLDVEFFSCRGYTSQSEMWAASQRFKRYFDNDQEVAIIHLGDHDPSGIDMSRDIEDRLALFHGENRVEVNRIALNMDQIRKYAPPPNPAKVTDSRAKGYIKKFGTESWELDALEPEQLVRLIQTTILSYRDEEKWKVAESVQEEHRKFLREQAERLGEEWSDR